MKRIPKLFIILMLGLTIPLISASGQDKKDETKVKVIVVDDSGTKTVIDTPFSGDKIPEAITMKNGEVIHLTKHSVNLEDLEKAGKGKKVMVTVSSDKNGEKNSSENIVIIDSDSTRWELNPAGEKGNVYVYSHASSGTNPRKHMIIASTGDSPDEWNISKSVTVSDDGKITGGSDKSYGISISDEDGSASDAPKYIIAKNGVVVTIQTDDEVKAKELQQLIENKLGVKKSDKK